MRDARLVPAVDEVVDALRLAVEVPRGLSNTHPPLGRFAQRGEDDLRRAAGDRFDQSIRRLEREKLAHILKTDTSRPAGRDSRPEGCRTTPSGRVKGHAATRGAQASDLDDTLSAMRQPPYVIDGARVLRFADLSGARRTGRTRHLRDGQQLESFAGLALARYEDEPDAIYLFYCDGDWNCLTHTHHATVEAAEAQARFEFEGVVFTDSPDAP